MSVKPAQTKKPAPKMPVKGKPKGPQTLHKQVSSAMLGGY